MRTRARCSRSSRRVPSFCTEPRPEGSARTCGPDASRESNASAIGCAVYVVGRLAIVAEVTPGAVEALSLAPGIEVWAAVKATEVDVYPA